jgi:DNA-binding LacI/PurR family transcriptional regulator
MSKKRVSIIDIAKQLQLSPSTVSRALRNESRIAITTRQSVQKLAKELGYRPNPQARSLLNQRTYIVGLIVPDFVHPFFSMVLAGIENVLTEAGFQLMICTSQGKWGKEKQVTEVLADARVDGLLVSYARDTTDFTHFRRLQEEEIPVVFFDRLCEDLDATYIISDDFKGATEAVEHLLQTGCRRIAHLKGPEHISTTFNRYLGYREALKKQGLPIEEALIFHAEDDKGLRLSDTDRLRASLPDIDAIFAFNDYIAYELVRIIREEGLRIPEDISLIGYGNDPFGRYLHPQLTTVDQNPWLMGQQSARMLLDQIFSSHAHFEHKAQLLDTQLILRGTTRVATSE